MDVKLVVAEGAKRNQTFHLHSANTLIGRQKGSGLRIPSSSVSRRHSQLSFANGLLNVEDLDSANGTFVNGRRISTSTVLRPGDRLQVGDIVFVVHYRLTQNAVERLSQEERRSSEFEAVDVAEGEVPEVVEVVEEIVEESDEDLDEAIPLSDEHSPSPFEVEIVEDSPQRAKAERAKAERAKDKRAQAGRGKKDDESADPGKFLDRPWNAPAGDDLRDILTRMEKDNKKR
ncbi:MAG: FHA domain-containing protein [Planctomycetes bacterium]|nr:FHA domain-containing protein [Planctomycetota bacterium]